MADETRNGQVVVITGASAGIGAALARRVSALGGIPVLVARRREALEALAAELTGPSLVVDADVTQRAAVDAIVPAVVQAFGRLDVWVNNAGRGITCAVSKLTDEDLDDMFRVNLKSALYGMQAPLAQFRAQGRGQIINVSSVLGRVPFAAFRSAYSASKAALNALTSNLRVELAGSGIAVTLVSPGPVATEFGVNALHGGPDNRKMPGAQTADEVAEVIADAIGSRAADVYTRPAYHGMVASYYAATDLAEVESRPPFVAPR